MSNRGNTQIIDADEGRVQNIADLDVLGVACQVRAWCRVAQMRRTESPLCAHPHPACALSERVHVAARFENVVVESLISVVYVTHTSSFTGRVELVQFFAGHYVLTYFRQPRDEPWIGTHPTRWYPWCGLRQECCEGVST